MQEDEWKEVAFGILYVRDEERLPRTDERWKPECEEQ
jgi:hypothetical protein